MCKKSCFQFLIFLVPLLTYGQVDDYAQSGYTSLVIKFSGDYPKDKTITTPMLSNLLLTDKPTEFEVINDSTLLLSYYTFGPSPCYFFYNKDYCTTLLLPNQSDVLNIHYVDTAQYSMNYKGSFKELFDHSKAFGEMIREALFSGNYFFKRKARGYQTANEFRDYILELSQQMITEVTKDNPSELVKQLFRYSMEGTTKLFYLFDKKRYNLRAYKEVKTDSGTIKVPLKRDITFYHGLNIPSHADTERLIWPHNELFKAIRQDSLLDLPNILKSDPNTYLQKLKKVFDPEVQDKNSLFYEIMIGGAYMDQINSGVSLSEEQKLAVIGFFQNRHISNYIIHHNDMNEKNFKPNAAKYYLPFGKEKEAVLSDILLRHKGQVVVMDFWATWCGPCIEAFDKIKPIKSLYANTKDVVFVYLAEESSDQDRWNEFVNFLGGEHYYLYKNQSAYIHKQYGIEYIPSYLIFDKKGELIEKSLGEYMGNEKLTEWIEKGLKE